MRSGDRTSSRYGFGVSLLWALPAAVLVVGAVVTARLSTTIRADVELTATALAEAAEAVDVLGGERTDLAHTAARIERVLATVATPLGLVRQVRATGRHWWRRARGTSAHPRVPSAS